jgi:hypothetical protein
MLVISDKKNPMQIHELLTPESLELNFVPPPQEVWLGKRPSGAPKEAAGWRGCGHRITSR